MEDITSQRLPTQEERFRTEKRRSAAVHFLDDLTHYRSRNNKGDRPSWFGADVAKVERLMEQRDELLAVCQAIEKHCQGEGVGYDPEHRAEGVRLREQMRFAIDLATVGRTQAGVRAMARGHQP